MKIALTPMDKQWARLVKIRDNYRCRVCGRFGKYSSGGVGWKMESAHIIGRGKKTTRWLLENGLTMCFTCHRWSHENPLDWVDWLEKHLSKEFCQRLRNLSNETFKRSRDVPIWKENLNEQEEELTGGDIAKDL